jgi:predicted phosphodiesterase
MTEPFQTARDPFLSVYQAAAAAVARRRAIEPGQHPLMQAASHLTAASRDPTRGYAPPGVAEPSLECAGLGLELLRATVAGDAERQRALHDRLQYSECDPLWAETLVEYARRFLPDGVARPVPYRRHIAMSDFVRTMPSPAMRIGLISDWGTGTETARQVAELLARQRPDLVIHLGDIYYAGTAEECARNFEAPMRAAMPDTPLYTLCGNHDVYSGGEGYYGLLDRIGQPASYFCARSPDNSWQILAADTGLNDRDPFDEAAALTFIEPGELEWHADKLRGFAGRTVFLTHHQPFSAFAQIGPLASHDPTNPKLMAAHATLAAAGRIDAWFWGHEHRLRLYAPYRGVAAGRNVGYGAIPVLAVPDPNTTLPDLVDPPPLAAAVTLDVVTGASTHGFALLTLGADEIGASYWALTRPDGPIHEEIFPGGQDLRV